MGEETATLLEGERRNIVLLEGSQASPLVIWGILIFGINIELYNLEK
jgi:hypothetical protein